MPTALSMMEALGNNFPGLIQLLTVVAYLLGMWAGISAFVLLRKRNRYDPAATLGAIGVRMWLCALFLFLPTAIGTALETFFGAPTLVGYTAGSVVPGPGRAALAVVVRFVQVVGLWAFIWGWNLWGRAHQRGYDAVLGNKAIAHIVGGVFAMNLIGTLQAFAQTFGLEKLLNYIVIAG